MNSNYFHLLKINVSRKILELSLFSDFEELELIIWNYLWKSELYWLVSNKLLIGELKSNVKLTYRGNKCTTDKGKHSERRDVLYKTFIRTIRRYLCNMFEDEFRDFSKIKKTDSDLFKRNVTTFYEKYFKDWATFQMDASEDEHEHFCYILGVLITSKVSFPSKTDEMKKQLYLFRSILKKFWSTSYPQFFLTKLVPEFFRLMNISGAISKCIEVYPKLNQSKDAYFQIVDSIIDFKVNPFLLK